MRVSRVLAVVAVAAFSVVALASGLDRLSGNMPGMARIVPPPFRAHADRAAASTALDRKDNAGALVNSRNAVATDPVDPDATAWLGSALMQVGRIPDAERTFRVAAKFGWRNVQTQAFWYDVALQAGDYEVASERLDALLRVHPRLVEQPEVLQPMESDPAARKSLVDRMRLRPPWLDEYLQVTDDTPSDVLDRRLAVMAQLNSSGAPASCQEVFPFTRALLDDGRRRDAETLWNANCPSLKVAGLVSDPTFAHVLETNARSPFSWRVASSGDLSISPARAGAGGLALSNTAPGTRLTLMQTVAFPPGAYRFHVSQPEGAKSAAGKLYLSWACDQKPPFPDKPEGDLASGQVIHVAECDRQLIGIWLRGGGSSVNINSIAFEKVG
jgi:hypothetical protein